MAGAPSRMLGLWAVAAGLPKQQPRLGGTQPLVLQDMQNALPQGFWLLKRLPQRLRKPQTLQLLRYAPW